MPETQSQEKKDMLRLAGAELRLVPAKPYRDPETLRAFLRRAIEEEEPSRLTGAPLHSSLDSVRRRIEATETRLIDLVASSHADVNATLALGEHVAHEIGALRAGMDAVSHDELQHRVHGVVVSRGRMRDELASARRVRDTLQLLCDMHDAVSRFDAALARGDICEGSNALHSMTSQLSALRASASLATSPRLLDMLQKKTISAQAELSASASAAWDGVARVETAEKVGGACSSPAAGAGCELILVGSGVDGAVDPSIVLALRRTQRLSAPACPQQHSSQSSAPAGSVFGRVGASPGVGASVSWSKG